MNRRNIVFAVATLFAVIAVSDSGTFALFYDIEASVGNSFTAWSSSGWVQTTADDFDLGISTNVDTTTSPGNVLLEKGDPSQYVFAFQGGGSAAFHRYDVVSNTWTTVASAPGAVTEGACLAFDQGSYIYALHGGSNVFWRYNTVQNSWEDGLKNAPGPVGSGADLAYDADGKALYALQGGSGTGLWRYDITSDSWTVVGSISSGVSSGGAMALYESTLYIMQGSGTLNMWTYNIKSEAWSSLSTPASWLNAGLGMVLGSDGSLYALYLQNSSPNGAHTYSYDIDSGTWFKEDNLYLGTNIQNGIDLAFDGNYVYALQPEKTNEGHGPFWRCDLNAGWWGTPESAKYLPGRQVGSGASLVSVTLGGQYAYQGTLISSIFDASTTAIYTALSWSANLPSGTDIRFEIRAADTVEGLQSSSWDPVDGSPASFSGLFGRYAQWRAILITADPHQTPVLQEVRLSYRLVTWSSYTWLQTTMDDFNSGMPYNIDTATVPGSAMLTTGSIESYLFAFQGGGSAAFHRYNVISNSWDTVAAAFDAVGEGACLAFDQGSYIYALRGGHHYDLWRYDIQNNSWKPLSSAPGPVGSGADLVYDADGKALYALQGGSGTGLWRYDITSDSWAEVGNTPAGVSAGGAMALYESTLYIMQGSGTLNMWTYNIKSEAWSSLNLPSNRPGSLTTGSDMTLGSDGQLFTMWLSGNQGCCYIYDIQSDTWIRKGNLDWGTNIQNGIDLAFDGNYVYALQSIEVPGSWWGPFWRCDLNAGWWSWNTPAKKLPGAVGPGASLVSVTLGGQFVSQGILTSSTFDTGAEGTAYDSLLWAAALPSGTSIRFEVRASDTLAAGQPDAEWIPVSGSSGSSLGSLSGRYVQWKAILTTDDPTQTPLLHEVKLYYRG